MSDFESKTKETIDSVAKAAKNAVTDAVDKAKDLAHGAGEKLQEGAKKLKDA